MPPETDRMRALVAVFADEASKAGFGQVTPPMFEEVGVFARIGDATDVVSKELYAFQDKGGRDIALRPEQTASVCRMFAQRRPLTPWKVWYSGPNFRYDKPQKGRYRQFDQVGVELIGGTSADLDTEVILLASRFFQRIGLTRLTLLINSLGDREDRARYTEALREYFVANADQLTEQSRTTLAKNPLRVLDSKRPPDAEVIANAPLLESFLSDDSAAAFDRVQLGLTNLGVDFQLAPRLVRGLDYYNRTTFEFAATGLEAAQNAVGGGGRYDGLVEDLGGPPEPGVGFALGVDRTLLALDAEDAFPALDSGPQVFVVTTTEGTEGLELCDQLRSAGVRADRAETGRSMKGQMKAANRSGAAAAIIVGPDEVKAGTATLKPLRSQGDQQTIPADQLLPALKELL